MTTERQVSRGAANVAVAESPSVLVDLSSNDYLGLRNDPRVRAAAIRGIERYGVGSGGAREVAAGMDVVHELETRLARYKGVPNVRMAQSGYAANIGLVPVLVGPGDVVILDRQAHRSSADGALLSGASVRTYPHADMTALADAVALAATRSRKILIITDGVFGLSGDIAPLPTIVEIAERHGAFVMVDDAHGSGVLGGGRGTVAHFGLVARTAVQVGTASKAMGVLGGYVALFSDELAARLAESRTVTHSTALPAHLAASCLASLDIMESEPERIERLWANRHRLANGLRAAGFDIGPSETPIVPVILRDPASAVALGSKIRGEGLVAGVLVPPKVAPAESRLRLIATASHSPADIDLAVSIIAGASRSIAGTAESSARV
jgi:glycine C-acetyltransferase